jgi:chemotaxis-related protein WspB
MVALTFEVNGQKYGLDVSDILEVLPAVPVRRLPQVPDYVAGVFRYHGTIVPLIDLSCLIGGRQAASLLSTRIILVKYPSPTGADRLLGLLAERATNLEDIASELQSPGYNATEAPYLGGLSGTGGMTQYVNVERLLPESLRERLFIEG